MKFIKKHILVLLTFLAVFVFSLRGLYGEDIWFHLATGRYVFEHQTIPIQDVFSFTRPGATWINQGWLADLVFYLIIRVFGPFGLAFFFTLLSVAVFVLLYLLLRALKVKRNLSLFLTFWAAFIATARFQARPEPGSYFFLLLIAFLLVKWQAQKKLFFLPLIFLVWVNWQAGFVPYGAFLLGVFLLKDFLEKPTLKKPLFWASLLSAGALLLNPNGLGGVLYFVKVQPGVLHSDFTEWGSLVRWLASKNFSNVEESLLNFGYLFSLAVFLAFSFFWVKATKFKPPGKGFWLIVAAPFILAPFYGNRFSSLGVIFICILVGVYSLSLPRAKPRSIGTTWGIFLSLSLVLLITREIVYPPSLSTKQKANPYRDEVLAFIKKEGIQGRMFNTLEDGGYFLWKDPEKRIFMDGRLDVYTQSGLYGEYSKVYSFPPKDGWQEVLKKYDIEYLLLPGWQKEVMEEARKSGFEIVYWSDYLFLLVKKMGVNQKYVEEKAVTKIEPFKGEDYLKEVLEEVVKEYEILEKRSPISANIAIGLGSVYQQSGKITEAIAEYERALKIEPKKDDARLALGVLYSQQKNCGKAIEHFSKARKSQSKGVRAIANRNLGFVYYDCVGDLALAHYYFKQFLKLGTDPSLLQEARTMVGVIEEEIRKNANSH